MLNLLKPFTLAASGLALAMGLAMPGFAQDAASQSIVLYNGQHKNATAALIEAFEAKTGINVERRDGSTNELAHQIVEEGAKSPADVFYTEETSPLFMLASKGLLAKMDAETIAAIPDEYKDPDGRWVGVLARSRVIVFNPDLINENDLPESVLDLTDPAWKGKFAFVPTSGAFQAQLSATIKLKGRDAAKEWLLGLKENGRIYKKNPLVLAAVERGEIPFGLINNYYWDGMVREKGIDAVKSRLHFFDNHDLGGMLTVSGMAVLESSQHNQAAQEFVKFATSEEGQQVLTNKSNQYPLNPAVKPAADLKPFSELSPPEGTLDLGEFSDGKAAVELLQEVGLL